MSSHETCACGTFAIGLCADCATPVCGTHSALIEDRRLCDVHREGHEREVAERKQKEAQLTDQAKASDRAGRKPATIGRLARQLAAADCPGLQPRRVKWKLIERGQWRRPSRVTLGEAEGEPAWPLGVISWDHNPGPGTRREGGERYGLTAAGDLVHMDIDPVDITIEAGETVDIDARLRRRLENGPRLPRDRGWDLDAAVFQFVRAIERYAAGHSVALDRLRDVDGLAERAESRYVNTVFDPATAAARSDAGVVAAAIAACEALQARGPLPSDPARRGERGFWVVPKDRYGRRYEGWRAGHAGHMGAYVVVPFTRKPWIHVGRAPFNLTKLERHFGGLDAIPESVLYTLREATEIINAVLAESDPQPETRRW